MILRSNFRDYYDGVIAHGLDTDTAYNRFTKLDDITMRDIKGFDKLSFKKEKAK